MQPRDMTEHQLRDYCAAVDDLNETLRAINAELVAAIINARIWMNGLPPYLLDPIDAALAKARDS